MSIQHTKKLQAVIKTILIESLLLYLNLNIKEISNKKLMYLRVTEIQE